MQDGCSTVQEHTGLGSYCDEGAYRNSGTNEVGALSYTDIFLATTGSPVAPRSKFFVSKEAFYKSIVCIV